VGIRDAWAALRGVLPYQWIEAGPWVDLVNGMTPADLWRTQPHLRTVVDFLARNIAQLGVHTYQRVSDTDRKRLTDDPMARLLARPNSHMTTYELMYQTVADLALWDEAFWWCAPDTESPVGWSIQPISPAFAASRRPASMFTIDAVQFINPQTGARPWLSVQDGLVWFHRWNPGASLNTSSPVDALRDILAEQMDARQFRTQMWRRGGRFGGYLSRPVGAKWDKDTRTKFIRQWQAKFSGDGTDAGGTPILEDGMTWQQSRFSAREEEWAEGTKLSLAQVASVYQVNPTMVGLLDNANFSNVQAFRQMLYSDTLGAPIAEIEGRINTFIVPKVSKASGVYVELNIAGKLKGSFEEQAQIISTSVGRPWMTADEARARFNMPALGGDAGRLVIPLNVLIGGQASPRDSGTQNLRAKSVRVDGTTVHIKAEQPSEVVDQVTTLLERFFRRQRQVILSRLGAKDDDWWDEERWDSELSDDLYRVAVTTATQLGQDTAAQLGFDPADYDEARTMAFLRSVADSRASWINQATKSQIQDVLDAADFGEDDGPTIGSVFDVAEGQRSGAGASSFTAFVAGFAVTEATRQLAGPSATKTWLTNSGNPRPDHAAMDGETVAINDTFSNGANWPGDPELGAEGVANCQCTVEISYDV